MSRAKHWCFTYNNYGSGEGDFRDVVERLFEEGIVTYVVYGREVGDGGTPHLQGYVEFAERKRLQQCRDLLGPLHFEPRRGSAAQAAAYCQKDGDFSEWGTISAGQGHRSDLDAIKEKLDAGASNLEIATEYFSSWCRYRKSFDVYRDLKRPNTRRNVRVVYIHGPPGTGKTGLVFTIFPDVWLTSFSNLQWFDGYDGQDVVCLDDYRGGASDSDILRFLDIYPVRVPFKGTTFQWMPTRIFITSNLQAIQLHERVSDAFMRRIHRHVEVSELVDFDNLDSWREKLII